MNIAIIGSDNGVGLTRDSTILTGMLQSHGHNVWFSDWRSTRPITADINIHLELIGINALRAAKVNVFIPNPEWIEHGQMPYLSRINVVFAKTQDTKKIFSNLHRNVTYTGFTSIDRYMPDITKKKVFAHFQGKSEYKGTAQVMQAARNAKVRVHHYKCNPYLNDDEYKIAQNTTLIHLCPSIYEGFGHYINEAKSCGAVILTTNHPPMNELIRPEFGFAAAPSSYKRLRLATAAYPDIAELSSLIHCIEDTEYNTLLKIGEKARQSYLNNDKIFKEKFIYEINKL